MYATVRGKVKMRMHKSSVLHRSQPKCVLYTTAVQTGPATHEMFEPWPSGLADGAGTALFTEQAVRERGRKPRSVCVL